MSSQSFAINPYDPIRSLGINPNDPRFISNLITTPALEGSYRDASDHEKRESCTVPLWEDILNEYMRDRNMSVHSQQPVDKTTKAVDLTVGYYDQSWQKVFVLLLECKRHNWTERMDLESQLVACVQDYFYKEGGGLAKRDTLFGGVAYGTKIRVFFFQDTPDDLIIMPLWDGKGRSDEVFYRNPKLHGKEILAALHALRNYAPMPLKELRRPYGLLSPLVVLDS